METLDNTSGMKDWPPKPGTTDMTRTIAQRSSHGFELTYVRGGVYDHAHPSRPSASMASKTLVGVHVALEQFGVERHDIRARGGELRTVGQRILDHEMAIEGQLTEPSGSPSR